MGINVFMRNYKKNSRGPRTTLDAHHNLKLQFTFLNQKQSGIDWQCMMLRWNPVKRFSPVVLCRCSLMGNMP